ncbi:MAG: hypothetical protein GEU78_01855 [Actinobacteria bacterium]|nr:hypothetical protein [Actinomycetota bacterium]
MRSPEECFGAPRLPQPAAHEHGESVLPSPQEHAAVDQVQGGVVVGVGRAVLAERRQGPARARSRPRDGTGRGRVRAGARQGAHRSADAGAEDLTFEADERGAKKRDYWFTVLLADPLATPLAGLLAKRRWLTPDQVTILSLIAGLSVGFFFAAGARWGLIAGGVAFYVAFVLDCTDGKLARATGVTSAKGRGLDALADGGRRASAILGLGILYWRLSSQGDGPHSGFDPATPLWDRFDGWFLDGFLLLTVYAVLAYYFLEISGAAKGDPAGGVRGRWSQALARHRLLPTPGMPDVQAVVFIFGPVTGFVVPALYVAIAMVSVAILLTVIRRLR